LHHTNIVPVFGVGETGGVEWREVKPHVFCVVGAYGGRRAAG
jgi:hypothetical protein